MPTEQWFDELYTEFHPKLMAVILRLTEDTYLAEDIVQSTFTALHKQRAGLIDHPNIRGWLVVTARKMLQTEMQRRSYTQEVPLDEGVKLVHEPEHEDRFRNAIPAVLSPEEELILDLFYRQGYSHAEIGQYLGCSEAACRMRLFRILSKCRKLSKYENF